MFHYTITAVELGSGDDEGYFANHKQMEHYCAKCRDAVKTVGEIPDWNRSSAGSLDSSSAVLTMLVTIKVY